MKSNDLDRRMIKTRSAIQDALFSLMQEKQYNKITIQDIIDKANVGRSTFYAHFATKDELLFYSIEHLLEMLNQYIESYVEHNGDKRRLIPVVELFEHIKENRKIFRGLIKSESTSLFFEKAGAYWNNGIEKYLKMNLREGEKPKVPIEILSNHITNTLINLLMWWVNSNMAYTPLQMEKYFEELVNPCIDSVLYNK